MRILVLAPVIPYPPTAGLKLRVLNLARELARRHTVDMFCLSTEPPSKEQEQAFTDAGIRLLVAVKPEMGAVAKAGAYLRRLARGVPPEFILSWDASISAQLDGLAREDDYDVVIAEHLFMARFAAGLACPRVMVLHNIESDLAFELARTFPPPRRQYKRITARWAAGYERRMLGRMQGAVTVTAEDLERLGELAPGLTAAVVENGVDCAAYRGIAAGPAPPGRKLLYLGLMSYESNIDAVRWFARDVLPRVRERYPDTVFTVAGADPVPAVSQLAELPGVEVTGFVDDVMPLYRESTLMVVPLRLGGGSRLKILEAFAAGTPVVATAKGAEGLAVKDGRHLLLADSPAAMAGAIGRLFAEPDTYAALRRQALSLVEERYDWPILAERLEQFLVRVAGSG